MNIKSGKLCVKCSVKKDWCDFRFWRMGGLQKCVGANRGR